LLADIIYKRDANNTYLLSEKNEFIQDNMNAVLDRITRTIRGSWEGIRDRKPFLRNCTVHIDFNVLKQVLVKYSRDVFGQKRLLSILKKVPKYGATLDSMEIYGMKINSFNPYLHRRAGCFMYWCCALKPFHIMINNRKLIVPEKDQYIMDYFNEITAYNLVRVMLGSCSILRNCNYNECEYKKRGLSDSDCCLSINIEENNEFFKDFLYDVHFRSISRSSFELLMARFCIIPHCKKGDCPLINFNLQNGNLKFIDEFAG
jgi:hypothetical protein